MSAYTASRADASRDERENVTGASSLDFAPFLEVMSLIVVENLHHYNSNMIRYLNSFSFGVFFVHRDSVCLNSVDVVLRKKR